MSDDYPIYCPAQTFRGNRFEPAEYCENEVFEEGDLCPEHEDADRADADYDAWRERD